MLTFAEPPARQLMVSGWVDISSEDYGDLALLLITPVHNTCGDDHAMIGVAKTLGLLRSPGASALPGQLFVDVTILGITLHLPHGGSMRRPMPQEWMTVAARRGQVWTGVGLAALGQGMVPASYLARQGVIGRMTPVVNRLVVA